MKVEDGHRPWEQPEYTQALIHTAENLRVEEELHECSAYHDIHLCCHTMKLLFLCGESAVLIGLSCSDIWLQVVYMTPT